ncbi:MAG TPA: 1-deoxy-D-xylulose-5-phosphate reductoisomerase [Planctomycetota bacterium]|jgi:1-deoxy-D-xylulose-5-phosphate reductoisomerase|nr:1-deoxy-D-xylulose-5-phosphate reductoisomerase [Planctomycetota bacterium]
MKRLAILGSTGSIGVNGLDVAAHLGLSVTGLAAGANRKVFREQIDRFRPARAALADAAEYEVLKKELNGSSTVLLKGMEGVRAIAAGEESDVVLCAISGAACLGPVIDAVDRGKTLGLANKESMVVAGPIVLERARKSGATIVPVDSEHSAIFQSMRSGAHLEVKRIFLTASGGPFRETPKSAFGSITVEQALKHPTWNMGGKITIDSATMFNKALEIVEARWLFDLKASQIEVIVHPQSIIHSMVEFVDGSVIAQLGLPDMRTPIQFALTYPGRSEGNVKRLNLAEIRTLTFQEPDLDKFPSLKLGWRAAEAGGTMGAVLNAANEVAVDRFVKKEISFLQIFETVKTVMDRHALVGHPTLEDVLQADAWARQEARCINS